MPTHKPKVYWELRSNTHQKDTPGCENDQSITPACKQKMRIIFCTAKVAYQFLQCGCHFFAHSKITTSCKILILHLLHCKTSLVFGDVGLMSHFCVTFVVQNLWGYLGGVPEDSVPCHLRRFASHYRRQRGGCCSSPRSRCKRARGDLIHN